MKRIFLDTNFVIDYLLRPEYKPVCQDFLAKGTLAGLRFYISALTVANFAYIARKSDRTSLYNHLHTLTELFVIVDLTSSDIADAIAAETSDYEDALQYYCALRSGCTAIITRNVKDFSFAEMPVMSSLDYLERYL